MAKTRTLTINVDEESDRKFRGVVKLKYGRKKGALGKAMTLAMDKWVKEAEEKDFTARSIELLKKGIAKKKWRFNKEELYEGRT